MEQIGHIERKSMLYRTKVEYGDWAMNHVQGCAHGCNYPCYAFLMARRFGRVKTYKDWKKPLLVDNTLSLLMKELPRYRDEIKQVQLCFTTDPFMEGFPEVGDLSIQAIKLINSFNIPCVILTKGILPSELALLPKAKLNVYGIIFTSANEQYRELMEPGAVNYLQRLTALKYLHDKGMKTWVSMEPYPTPNVFNQDLNQVLEKVSFVDRIVFGRTHYDKRTTAFAEHDDFYRSSAEKVKAFCDKHEIECHIKKGTVK